MCTCPLLVAAPPRALEGQVLADMRWKVAGAPRTVGPRIASVSPSRRLLAQAGTAAVASPSSRGPQCKAPRLVRQYAARSQGVKCTNLRRHFGRKSPERRLELVSLDPLTHL